VADPRQLWSKCLWFVENYLLTYMPWFVFLSCKLEIQARVNNIKMSGSCQVALAIRRGCIKNRVQKIKAGDKEGRFHTLARLFDLLLCGCLCS
jgi:hypothetical protein